VLLGARNATLREAVVATFKAESIDVRRVFDTNLFGRLAVTKAMLPMLHKLGSARVVNVVQQIRPAHAQRWPGIGTRPPEDDGLQRSQGGGRAHRHQGLAPCPGMGMFGTSAGRGAVPGEATRIFNSYAEAGGNFIDTSEAYQFGEAESLAGAFTASRHDEFVIASKYGRSAAALPSPTALGTHPKAMVRSVGDSLKRMKTDRIDIYLSHFDDGITPVEEVARGFDDLVRAGKMIYTGF